MEPTAAPSSGLAQSHAIGTHSSRSAIVPGIAGSAVGLLLLSSLAVFLVNKRRREKAVWRKNGTHLRAVQEEDDVEQAIKSNGPVMSEAGSSRLGRMLLSTAATVHCGVRATKHQSEATPSQSSSDDDFSGFDGGDFDGCGISVEPIILPIDTDEYMESIEVQEGGRDLESGIAALASQVVPDEPNLAKEPVQEPKPTKEPPSTDMNADEGALFIESIVADFYGGTCAEYAALTSKDEVDGDSELRVDTVNENVREEEEMEKDTVEALHDAEHEREFDAICRHW